MPSSDPVHTEVPRIHGDETLSAMGWYHRVHGGPLHDLVITRVEYYVVTHDGILKSIDGFKDKYRCPCEPDVFCAKMDRKRGLELCVVEVETDATKQSRETKWNQYKESTAGITHFVVLDLNDLLAPNNWRAIDEFIEERMFF